MPQCGQGDIYVRFRLGDQKYKSKVGLVSLKVALFLQFSYTRFTRAPLSF